MEGQRSAFWQYHGRQPKNVYPYKWEQNPAGYTGICLVRKNVIRKSCKKAPKDLQMPRNPHPCAINVRISSLYCGF